MARPFAKLRGAMVAASVDRAYVAQELLICECTVGNKLRAQYPWTQDEQYALMRMLRIPFEQMHEYFPYRGRYDPLPEKVPLTIAAAEQKRRVKLQKRVPPKQKKTAI
jgi:hypothetical protein